MAILALHVFIKEDYDSLIATYPYEFIAVCLNMVTAVAIPPAFTDRFFFDQFRPYMMPSPNVRVQVVAGDGLHVRR
ncbi:hypothetical protein HCH_06184 [Hahella chejuensis KCTC 2396]|uniref:Uncharacterized protein n=1 Tax=Hahella chejuensis (strain KCTC 2396) TaxID=349521 RepID=Q2S946_HAHCH|nr:hypothetical protein [Hahella chejuensis]ABC32828.1 hypothetical protein HCH_06184 [Hahella chejuensis KCTC 2396]